MGVDLRERRINVHSLVISNLENTLLKVAEEITVEDLKKIEERLQNNYANTAIAKLFEDLESMVVIYGERILFIKGRERELIAQGIKLLTHDHNDSRRLHLRQVHTVFPEVNLTRYHPTTTSLYFSSTTTKAAFSSVLEAADKVWGRQHPYDENRWQSYIEAAKTLQEKKAWFTLSELLASMVVISQERFPPSAIPHAAKIGMIEQLKKYRETNQIVRLLKLAKNMAILERGSLIKDAEVEAPISPMPVERSF